MKRVNLAGRKFGMWRVIRRATLEEIKAKGCTGLQHQWLCECNCGTKRLVRGDKLVYGESRSCRCQGKGYKPWTRSTKPQTPEARFQNIHSSMKKRCYCLSYGDWMNYGGRGITVADEWHSIQKFKDDMWTSFINHVNKFGLKQTTLDRIDSDKGYYHGNCRFVSPAEQNQNTRMVKTFKAVRIEDNYFEYGRNKKVFAKKYELSVGGMINCLLGKQHKHQGWSFQYI